MCKPIEYFELTWHGDADRDDNEDNNEFIGDHSSIRSLGARCAALRFGIRKLTDSDRETKYHEVDIMASRSALEDLRDQIDEWLQETEQEYEEEQIERKKRLITRQLENECRFLEC